MLLKILLFKETEQIYHQKDTADAATAPVADSADAAYSAAAPVADGAFADAA